MADVDRGIVGLIICIFLIWFPVSSYAGEVNNKGVKCRWVDSKEKRTELTRSKSIDGMTDFWFKNGKVLVHTIRISKEGFRIEAKVRGNIDYNGTNEIFWNDVFAGYRYLYRETLDLSNKIKKLVARCSLVTDVDLILGPLRKKIVESEAKNKI